MESFKCLTKEAIELLNRNGLLESLIINELIQEQISKIDLDKNFINDILKSFYKSKNINNEEDLKIWLDKNNLSKESFIEKIFKDPKFNKLVLEKFSHKIESHFLKKKDDLDIIVYSLLRLKDPFQARELHLQISEGEADIGDLAKKYSEGQEKNTRGIVGPTPINKAHPILVDFFRSGKEGDLSKPMQIEDWIIIVRIEYLKEIQLEKETELIMAKELFQIDIANQAKLLANDMINQK